MWGGPSRSGPLFRWFENQITDGNRFPRTELVFLFSVQSAKLGKSNFGVFPCPSSFFFTPSPANDKAKWNVRGFHYPASVRHQFGSKGNGPELIPFSLAVFWGKR